MAGSKKRHPTYKSQVFVGRVSESDTDGIPKRIVIPNNPALVQHFLKTECRIGDVVSMYFTSKRPKRSLLQNNYMHLYFSLIGLSSGHSIEEIKVWAKGRFLSKGITEVYGNKVRVVKNTSDLTIGEMCEFLMRVEDETGIPPPVTEPFLRALTEKEYSDLKEEQKIAYERMKPKIVIKI